MKGGGFLVFIFLLFCLLFGAGMVINAIGNIFRRWRNKDDPKQPQETPVQIPVMKSAIDPLAETLRQIREASELHKKNIRARGHGGGSPGCHPRGGIRFLPNCFDLGGERHAGTNHWRGMWRCCVGVG